MKYTTAIIQLPIVREDKGERVRTPEDAYRICADLAQLAQESFHVLILNAKNTLVERCMVSLGLVDASLVHPREVFRTAIHKNAAAIVLVHNHPSGDPTASSEDVRITRQLVEAGRIIDIKILDHVIIGRRSDNHQAFLSLREEGICTFN